MSTPAAAHSGPIALVGSGEYLPQMEDVDRELLAQVGGASANAVVLPTASGLEQPGSPRRWAEMGVRHFTRLGTRVNAVNILTREDAFDARWWSLLESADLIYFSGGSPRHVVDTLVDTPAWELIRARHSAGAVLAGCSAGAMAFGRLTLQPRALWGSNGKPRTEIWYPALGVLPGIIALPHFDRWIARMSNATLKDLAASLPPDVALVGVDEDTALVSLDGYVTWRVMGRQTVSLIDPERGPVRYTAGASLDLSGSVAPI